MQPPRVLHERAFPRDGQREEECVEARVVEALADVAPRREEETLLVRWNRGELGADFAIRLRALTALEDDEISRDALEATRKVLEVILALGEQDRRTPLLLLASARKR